MSLNLWMLYDFLMMLFMNKKTIMDCFIICIDYQLCAFMSQMNRLCFFMCCSTLINQQ